MTSCITTSVSLGSVKPGPGDAPSSFPVPHLSHAPNFHSPGLGHAYVAELGEKQTEEERVLGPESCKGAKAP